MTNETDRGPGRPPLTDGSVASSHLHLRCTQADKARWVKAAGGKKLSRWVTETLNAAAKP